MAGLSKIAIPDYSALQQEIDRNMIRTFFGHWGLRVRILSAVICWLAIAVLSLLPADDMFDRSFAPKPAQHFVAYLVAAMVASIVFPAAKLKMRLAICGCLITLAALMEFAQQFSPGRSLMISDFVGSSLGAALGVVFASALLCPLRGWLASNA